MAAELRSIGVRPFYDESEKVNLSGKHLYSHLDWVLPSSGTVLRAVRVGDFAALAGASTRTRRTSRQGKAPTTARGLRVVQGELSQGAGYGRIGCHLRFQRPRQDSNLRPAA